MWVRLSWITAPEQSSKPARWITCSHDHVPVLRAEVLQPWPERRYTIRLSWSKGLGTSQRELDKAPIRVTQDAHHYAFDFPIDPSDLDLHRLSFFMRHIHVEAQDIGPGAARNTDRGHASVGVVPRLQSQLSHLLRLLVLLPLFGILYFYFRSKVSGGVLVSYATVAGLLYRFAPQLLDSLWAFQRRGLIGACFVPVAAGVVAAASLVEVQNCADAPVTVANGELAPKENVLLWRWQAPTKSTLEHGRANSVFEVSDGACDDASSFLHPTAFIPTRAIDCGSLDVNEGNLLDDACTFNPNQLVEATAAEIRQSIPIKPESTCNTEYTLTLAKKRALLRGGTLDGTRVFVEAPESSPPDRRVGAEGSGSVQPPDDTTPLLTLKWSGLPTQSGGAVAARIRRACALQVPLTEGRVTVTVDAPDGVRGRLQCPRAELCDDDLEIQRALEGNPASSDVLKSYSINHRASIWEPKSDRLDAFVCRCKDTRRAIKQAQLHLRRAPPLNTNFNVEPGMTPARIDIYAGTSRSILRCRKRNETPIELVAFRTNFGRSVHRVCRSSKHPKVDYRDACDAGRWTEMSTWKWLEGPAKHTWACLPKRHDHALGVRVAGEGYRFSCSEDGCRNPVQLPVCYLHPVTGKTAEDPRRFDAPCDNAGAYAEARTEYAKSARRKAARACSKVMACQAF